MKFNEILIKNNICRKDIKPWHMPKKETIIEGDLINKLRENHRDIFEKQYGKISSFNFSRKVFQTGKWNELSKIARGLFLDNETGKIVARGYEKFFNYKENNFNTDDFLQNNLNFPVSVYRKYNGFLGILSIYDNEFIFCSKSTVEGIYAKYFQDIFEMKNHNLEYLKQFMIDNHICLIFEVIDPINDPHIVKYDKPEIILLDAIYLEEQFKTMSYETLHRIGKDCNFFVKEKVFDFNNYNELKNFIYAEENDMTSHKEGWVIVDKNNYHFKLKCKWYKTWKMLRGLKDRVGKGRSINSSGLTSSIATYFINWCQNQDRSYIENNDIIKLRDDYYAQVNNK